METKEDLSHLRCAIVGSFGPYNTESELVDACQRNAIETYTVVEADPNAVLGLTNRLRNGNYNDLDFIIWTSTKQHRDSWGEALQWELIATARKAGVPLVAYHLDRWIGLKRQSWIEDPYFQIDLVMTADGAHDDVWAEHGVKHRWLPPGVSERWCQLGTPREEYACDVLFVGNWRDYLHNDEWHHRPEMIDFLSRTYPNKGGHRGLMCIPRIGGPTIRGLELNDVYASAKVTVGDSALVPKANGEPMSFYCSDRCPEATGRGAYLLHPSVEGINTGPDGVFWNAAFPIVDHWELGDWAELRIRIDEELETGQWGTTEMRQARSDFIRERHSYTVRIRQIVNIMREEGLLS
jgi:hypothetical protein